MSGDVVIRAEGLGKKYLIGHQAERDRYTALRDVITRNARNFGRSVRDLFSGRPNVDGDAVEEFWALKELNIEIDRGRAVGVIGSNGAGKSTLLKILSRITEPSEGKVTIQGRIASLLEVGTGFHPELTGRENIYLNGAILGMSRKEIQKSFDEIVAFSEVERFLDTPVKRYSSGMYVRLAFGIAAHVQPEILIVDEVLAVGDASFQKKSLAKMENVAGAGRTVLFVSHNMAAVQALTSQTLWLDSGQVKGFGPTRSIIGQYMKSFANAAHSDWPPLKIYRRERGFTPVRFHRFRVEGYSTIPTLADTSRFTVNIDFESDIELRGAELSLAIKKTDGTQVTCMLTADSHASIYASPGQHTLACDISGLALAPGAYLADIGIAESASAYSWDVLMNYPLLNVSPFDQTCPWPDRPWGAVHCKNATWSLVTTCSAGPPAQPAHHIAT